MHELGESASESELRFVEAGAAQETALSDPRVDAEGLLHAAFEKA